MQTRQTLQKSLKNIHIRQTISALPTTGGSLDISGLNLEAGEYTLYYLGYNNHGTPISAYINDADTPATTFATGGTEISYKVDETNKTQRVFVAELTLEEALVNGKISLNTEQADSWLPDFYGLVIVKNGEPSAEPTAEPSATPSATPGIVINPETGKVENVPEGAVTSYRGSNAEVQELPENWDILFDGQTDAQFESMSNQGYLVIDLGQKYEISKIKGVLQPQRP